MKHKNLFHFCIISMMFCISVCAMAQGVQDDRQRPVKDVVLSDVVVTGTGTEHLLKNAPVQTEVITRKMLDSYGGRSIEEILGGLTASFAFSEGDMGSQMQLGGLGNNYILILIDGKRIHGDNGGENDLGLIDPNNIDRIEIVKGAQSALYGSDAMAGVINIITKKHDTNGVLLENTTRYGSHNDLRQHNGIGLRWGKLQSYTGFQLQHTDGWQNTSEQWAEGKILPDTKSMTVNKYTNWQISERLSYAASKNLELYADGSYYRKIINRPTDGRYASCDVYTYDLMYRNASASFGGKWLLGKGSGNDSESKASKTARHTKEAKTASATADYITFDLDWNKHAYFYKYTARTYEDAYVDGELEHGIPFYAGQHRLQSDQQRLMATAKGVFHLPHHNTLNTGAEYRYDYLNAPMRTETGTADDWTAAVYAQDEFDLIPWLNVTLGARLVDNASYGLHFSPKLSTMVSLGDFRIRMGWSQGFKSPTVKELYYRYLHVMGASTFFNMGNTNLNPQTSNYLSGNIEYRTARLTMSVTGYINNLDNMIVLVNVPVEEIPKGVTTAYLGDGSGKVVARMYKNMESAKTYGVDFNMSCKITNGLTFNGNYSYLDTQAKHYDADHNRMVDAIIDGMAHHKWNATMIYSHIFTDRYKLGASLSTRGSSKRYYENDGDGKPFQIWRLNTTHDFSGAKSKANKLFTYRIEAGIDNILNYRDTTMKPYHLGTTTSGRTFFVAFSVKFNNGKKVTTSNKSNNKNSQTNEED